MRQLLPLSAVVLCLAFCRHASADLMLEIVDLNLQYGQTGTIDVLVSDPGFSVLEAVGYEFTISQITSDDGTLEFTSASAMTSNTTGDSNYVYGTEGNISLSTPTSVTLLGTDIHSGAGASLGATQQLLVQLQVKHTVGTTVAGQIFEVALTASSGTLAGLVGSTSSATVTVNPEPSSLASMSVLCLVGCYIRRRKGKPNVS